LVLAALLSACSQLQAVTTVLRGSGHYQTRDYPIDGFTGITACCGFRVTVTGGPAFKVSVTADDNILDVLSVKKVGQTLSIDIDRTRAVSINSTKLEAAVTMPALQAVEVSGGGSQADVSGAAAAKATVTLSGGSRATVNVTGSLDYDLSGGSQLRYQGSPTIGRNTTSGGSSATRE
jgi:hypothetical protein